MDADYRRQLGERIVDKRKARGWNQIDLAREADMTDATVRKVEKGIEVSPAYLRRITDLLGMPPAGEDPELVFPPDVEGARRLVGMHLLSMDPEERVQRIEELTRFLMERWAATHPGQ